MRYTRDPGSSSKDICPTSLRTLVRYLSMFKLRYEGLTNSICCPVITAVNDEGGEVNVAFDHSHGSESAKDTIPAVGKRFKARNQPWALVVDENYGEGSAREHAAMQPRFLGCLLIVARSFARIHETNLKVSWFQRNGGFL